MQEEVEQKTVALVISAGKLTGRELKKAIVKLLAHMKDKKNHPSISRNDTDTLVQIMKSTYFFALFIGHLLSKCFN